MKTLELRNASKPLAHYTAELETGSLVITSNKKPLAALVSLKGVDRESLALSLSPDFAEIIRQARSEAKRGKVFSLDQVKEELLEETPPRRATQPSRTLTRPGRAPLARKKRSTPRG
jgi:hypothetical protein